MELQLKVRSFFCGNEECGYLTFAERFPEVVAPYARRTQRLAAQQQEVAFAVGGEVGARLLTILGMPISADTLIRLVRRAPEPEVVTPRVLGVDDWAKKKGQSYGTILVDLEAHRVIDLLDERSAESLSKWLQAHPGVIENQLYMAFYSQNSGDQMGAVRELSQFRPDKAVIALTWIVDSPVAPEMARSYAAQCLRDLRGVLDQALAERQFDRRVI